MTRNERIAHDIVCVAKYGSPGGIVYAEEVKRMQRYLEASGLVERPAPAPAVRVAPPVVRVAPPPPITVRLP